MNNFKMSSIEAQGLYAFCALFNKEQTAHGASEMISLMKDAMPNFTPVVADICDIDAEDLCLSSIMGTPMLKICLVLHKRRDNGLLTKSDLRNIIDMIDEIKPEELCKPVNTHLAELMNRLIYGQWCLLVEGIPAHNADMSINWGEGNKPNKDPDGTKHMVYALLGMQASLLKHYVASPRTTLKDIKP